jgi:hypothetical protein
MDGHWHELLTQVGREIASPLTSALDRLQALTATGRIDRQNLRALREEVESARRAGIAGQQLARFASGRVRQVPERVPLGRLLGELVQQRRADLQSKGLVVRSSFKDVDVVTDPALLFGLCNALLDWGGECARNAIDLRVSLKAWPVQAQLTCRFAWRSADDDAMPVDPALLDSLNWRLVQHMAWAMGLLVDRDDSGIETIATLQFPRALRDEVDADDGLAPSTPTSEALPSTLSSRPLAGSVVLAIVRDPALQAAVREAVSHMGLLLDFADDAGEARRYCAEGPPHAVVYLAPTLPEEADDIDDLRQSLRAGMPDLPFVELAPDRDGIDLAHVAGQPVTRVGLSSLRGGLPSALILELSRSA